MPQVSLYIDKETLEKITQLARKNSISVSRWVGENLRRLMRDDFPDDFWDVFGAIKDDSFSRPDALSLASDSKREQL